MNLPYLKFHVALNWATGDFDLSIGRQESTSKMYIAKEIIFEEHVQGAYTMPVLKLDTSGAQLLMDALFAAGVRPSKEFGQSSQMDSMKYHLEDMRKLVFESK